MIRMMLAAAMIGALVVSDPTQAQPQESKALAAALKAKDATAVKDAVTAARVKLGDKAGVPETPDVYTPIPQEAMPLTRIEAATAMTRLLPKFESLRWWKVGLDPTQLTHPLREPAAVCAGCLSIREAKFGDSEALLREARLAADFLMWSQDQAGTGVIPFPANRTFKGSKPFESSTRFLRLAEERGLLENVVRNGWAFEDFDDGGLQFDNGEAGVALFDIAEATGDVKYKIAANRAADWAITRPLVTNWNYNSFSVNLLARAFHATKDDKYLQAAKEKAILGVIPGQLTDGPHAGRWIDAHNARPGYHYIMLRGLSALLAELPKSDASAAAIRTALERGLKCRNAEIITRGAMNKDKVVETLAIVQRNFQSDSEFLKRTDTNDAWESMVKLASAEARRGKEPLGPREWGLLLREIR